MEAASVIRHAVTRLETAPDTPVFELNAPEILVRVNADNNGRFLQVHLRPYTAMEMKTTLKGLKARFRDSGALLIQEDADPAALRKLCDATFLGMDHVRKLDGSAPSIEEQREWLDRNPRIKARVANEAFATVLSERPQGIPVVDGDDVFELAFDEEAKIQYAYALWDGEGNEVVLIDITHHFQPDTEADFHDFDRATRRETDKRSGFMTIDIDYEALEKLYNRTVIRVEGMVLDGAALEPANKKLWRDRVPFWHKLFSLNQRFDEVAKKNIA